MSPDTEQLFQTAREMCLARREAFEKLSHGSPAFFIQKGGQFAALWDNHHNDGNIALLLAVRAGTQEALIESDPAVFYRPPYYGPSGWVGIRLDKGRAWTEIEELIEEAHEHVAAKRRRAKRKP